MYFSYLIGLFYKTNGRIYTLDKKRSSDKQEQLGIFSINDKLTQYKINWRRNIGRPLTRCEDDFWEEGRGQGA